LLLIDVLNEVLAELGIQDKQGAAKLEKALVSICRSDLPPGQLLVRIMARLPQSLIAGPEEFRRRTDLEFETRLDRTPRDLLYVEDRYLSDPVSTFSFTPNILLNALVQANGALLALEQFTRILRVPVSELLGLRNLSSLVSSVIVSELAEVCRENLFINPHQDGYPDLLPNTPAALEYSEEVRNAGRWSDKSAWTDTGLGGAEVKATCGNTPSASKIPKRLLGEERSDIIVGYDWKAHHRETRRLVAAIWDFVDTVPTVTTLLYRNDLGEEDWGTIVAPKEGGGRTTSVSIMTRSGVRKMAEGWMVRPIDPLLRVGLESGKIWIA